MQDAEMADLRGGLAVAGFEIEFGATITTLLDGEPVLTTTLTWTDAGAVIEQTLGGFGQSLDGLSADALEALGLGGLRGARGVVINDAAGLTAFVHNVADGALHNIIINSADGRNLIQEIEVDLRLPGFELVQNDLALERFGMRIGDDLRTVMVGLGE